MADQHLPTAPFDASGYWYSSSSEERGVTVLNTLRAYRAAEVAMRARTRKSMKMNDTDLAALRFLLRAQRLGETVTAKELAAQLKITSASTSVLINRLSATGHVQRHPHPTDKRGVLLTATGESNSEVRDTMSQMHARMISTAESLAPDQAAVVVDFLRRMTDAIAIDDHGVDDHDSSGQAAASDAPSGAEIDAVAPDTTSRNTNRA